MVLTGDIISAVDAERLLPYQSNPCAMSKNYTGRTINVHEHHEEGNTAKLTL